MDEALLLIQACQGWIYLALGLVGLAYLRMGWRRYRQRRDAVFGLERESADRGLATAVGMLVLVGAGVLATFVIATFLAPAVPASARPTAVPTVSLLASTPAPAGTAFAAATALPQATLDRVGCENPLATLTSPQDGASLSGLVTVAGTANIQNFAFYKYEYIPVSAGVPVAGAVWRAISAGTDPKVDEELGIWDTSIVTPGDYAFRLVVTDTAGNAPLPCVLTVRVLPSE
jgi:hypothetical protein